MEKNVRLRILSYGVILYLLLAFSWWSILLFVKNKDAYLAKVELLRIGLVAEGRYLDETTFQQEEAFQKLDREYQRQEWMIMGEAGVFVITLIIALTLINRSYHKEMAAAQQRRNFLLSITHELKSPIASIHLILETFQKRVLPQTKIEQFSQSALQETERLNQLVNNLLLSAKLETAYQPYFEEIDLQKVLPPLVKMLKTKHPHLQIRTTWSAPDDYSILGDQMGITSILLNLLENAVKYSESQANIHILIEKKPQQLQIIIKDQGHGIPDKEKEKVFEKFYRVGNEDTRKTKGTGLGLYIVKEIVEAHHGSIQLEDNHPKGSIFTLSFPNSTSRQQKNKVSSERVLDQKVT